jgi:hypothetical protein
MGLKPFYQIVTLIILKFLNAPEPSQKQAIAQLFLFGFPPSQEVAIKTMKQERLGVLINEWSEINKNHRKEVMETIHKLLSLCVRNRCMIWSKTF